jgi:hypothetical protein
MRVVICEAIPNTYREDNVYFRECKRLKPYMGRTGVVTKAAYDNKKKDWKVRLDVLPGHSDAMDDLR